ncbi:MAG: hypothetical protein ACYT04_44715 [Nostoc sp.]
MRIHYLQHVPSVLQIIENCASKLVTNKYIQKPEEMLARDDDFSNINIAMCKILEYFATFMK